MSASNYAAFLAVGGDLGKDKGDGLWAGMLVTDDNGIPVEYLATTERVKPTKLQRILYGGDLNAFVAHDVCAGKLFELLNGSSVEPSVVCAEWPERPERLERLWGRLSINAECLCWYSSADVDQGTGTSAGAIPAIGEIPEEFSTLFGTPKRMDEIFERVKEAYQPFLDEVKQESKGEES